MISPRLFLLLYCAGLYCVEGAQWTWECTPVKAQLEVDLDKVIGRWYIIEGISPGLTLDDNNCKILDISWASYHSRLQFRYHLKLTYEHDDSFHEIKDVMVKVVTPSKWIEDGDMRLVVDLPPDGNTLTIAYCTYAPYAIVYSRHKSPDLTAVHARLKDADIAGLEDARPFNRTGCPNILSSSTNRLHVNVFGLVTLLPLLKLL